MKAFSLMVILYLRTGMPEALQQANTHSKADY